ncbi:MAG: hypothetical protein GY853_09980 [PVC group bacterium]|nr:hypothetical protein [PVC group bacterium]
MAEYIIAANVALIFIAHFLPDDYRKILFSGKAGVNISNVWHNYEAGVR